MDPERPPNNRKIVLWAVAFVVALAAIIGLMVRYTNLTPAYASLVGTFGALFGVLVAQFFNTSIARSHQVHQQAMDNKRAQDDALQTYLDGISELLIDKQFRKAGSEDDKRAVARAKTLTLLLRLDGKRKRILLQFFHEASLIKREASDKKYTYPLIELTRADLSHARLAQIDLNGDDLSRADLSDAYLKSANLRGANLQRANLQRAILPGVELIGADLTGASLRDADLTGADLSKASLFGAILSGVNLSHARLEEADLTDADLRGANLRGANLQEAKGLTEEQVAKSRGTKHPSF